MEIGKLQRAIKCPIREITDKFMLTDEFFIDGRNNPGQIVNFAGAEASLPQGAHDENVIAVGHSKLLCRLLNTLRLREIQELLHLERIV